MITRSHAAQADRGKISLVVPCYNEEDGLRNMVYRLVEAMQVNQVPCELVLVDNGSTDNTGHEIDEMLAEGYPIRKVTVRVNQGYGYGVLCGLAACEGDYVGFLCADEQVDAADVARLCRVALRSPSKRLYKVRRRFRMESFARQVVSFSYNLLARLVFGDLGSGDLNGNPKLFPRSSYEQMNLLSNDWFLDAEVMIKARKLGLAVFELNVFSQMRAEGTSNVKPSTCWEFLKNLAYYRWGAGRLLMDRLEKQSPLSPSPSTIQTGKQPNVS
ncbi:MAG: glycosyltransferase family 2 protein [Bryobacterales bacterium]|nr:glycosyltransferase family 2 protein [Bryobacterales bacterium]